MPFSSLFRKPAPSPETERSNALIELIYSGHAMAELLVMADGRDYSCVCGMIVGPVENPSHHRNFCPVARFYAAVEAVRAAQLPLYSAEADRDCEALRNGTARYSTLREDVIVLGVLAVICAALIGVVVHFAPIIDAWTIPAWVKVLSIGVMVALIVVSRIIRHKKGI